MFLLDFGCGRDKIVTTGDTDGTGEFLDLFVYRSSSVLLGRLLGSA